MPSLNCFASRDKCYGKINRFYGWSELYKHWGCCFYHRNRCYTLPIKFCYKDNNILIERTMMLYIYLWSIKEDEELGGKETT